MHLSLASPWVDPRDTPRELFFVVKDLKLMTNSPSLKGKNFGLEQYTAGQD